MTVSIDGTEQLHLAVLQLARCSIRLESFPHRLLDFDLFPTQG